MNSAEPHARGATTREALLTAAQDVFVGVGYDTASIIDIVEQAGSSVGSLYHHFGGKADLWLALYESHQRTLKRRTADMFEAAIVAGETNLLELFVIGSRAYFDACWAERRLVRLFSDGDSPPEFGAAVRAQFTHWLTTNTARLSAGRADPMSSTLLLVLTTLARTGGQEVACRPSRAKATVVADEFLAIMLRLYT